jgi:hypothetical protein
MVDAWDLKSLGRKAVPVRVRPRVSSSITKFYKALSSVQRANLGQAAPDPQMAVGDRELGRAHPAPLQIAQHRGPTLRRLPLAALSTASTVFCPSASAPISTSNAALLVSSPAFTYTPPHGDRAVHERELSWFPMPIARARRRIDCFAPLRFRSAQQLRHFVLQELLNKSLHLCARKGLERLPCRH